MMFSLISLRAWEFNHARQLTKFLANYNLIREELRINVALFCFPREKIYEDNGDDVGRFKLGMRAFGGHASLTIFQFFNFYINIYNCSLHNSPYKTEKRRVNTLLNYNTPSNHAAFS